MLSTSTLDVSRCSVSTFWGEVKETPSQTILPDRLGLPGIQPSCEDSDRRPLSDLRASCQVPASRVRSAVPGCQAQKGQFLQSFTRRRRESEGGPHKPRSEDVSIFQKPAETACFGTCSPLQHLQRPFPTMLRGVLFMWL